MGKDIEAGQHLTTTETLLLRVWTSLTELHLDGSRESPFPDSAEVLHITGHAAIDRTVTDGGRITVPGGRRTSFRGLADLLARVMTQVPPLVMLTACETIHRNTRLPGEHVGLASMALELRARTVIGTLFPVPDRSMFAFTARFLRLLRSGSDPAAAWHQAVVWVAETGPVEIASFLSVLAADLGEHNAALDNLLAWLARRPAQDPPFASPVYWAAITCLGG